MKIMNFIPVGVENAVSGKRLCETTGLNQRTVKALIANERLRGAVICANLDGGGYFLPRTPDEAREYVHTESLRIASAARALAAAAAYVGDTNADEV